MLLKISFPVPCLSVYDLIRELKKHGDSLAAATRGGLSHTRGHEGGALCDDEALPLTDPQGA